MNIKTKQAIQNMILLAVNKIPYYQEHFKNMDEYSVENYHNFPVTTKDSIINSGKTLLNPDYQYSALYESHSSGTTGKVTTVYFNQDVQNKSLFELWYYRYKWYGIKTTDKLGFFYPGQDVENIGDVTDTTIALSKSWLYTEQHTKEAIEIFLTSQVKYMIIQPSTMIILHRVWKKYNLSPLNDITYIEFNGEYCEMEVMRKLAADMCPNAAIANQYGLQETQSVAYTCPKGHMHLMTKNCYAEIINKDENGIGDICLTTLNNYVMPYLRFITGDKGKEIELNEKCEYSNAPVIKVTRGRNNDFIRVEDGDDLCPYIMLQVIEMLPDYVIQYRITQLDYLEFLFDFVVDPSVDKAAIEAEVVRFLQDDILHKTIHCTFQYHEALLQDRKTGKQTNFVRAMED